MSEKLGLIISGVRGRMGQALVSSILESTKVFLAGGLEYEKHPEMGKPIAGEKSALIAPSLEEAVTGQKKLVLIEFTNAKASLTHLQECTRMSIPMVLGTTGFTDAEKNKIVEAAKMIPIVMASNFSIGINLMSKVIEELAAALPLSYDIEVVEMHHRHKKDSPSGTALTLAESLAKGRGVQLDKVACYHREGDVGARPEGEIGIQTLRGGDIVGDHSVYFAAPGERLEITHRATNRNNFASGAIRAAQWLFEGEQVKLPGLYSMRDVLGG